MKTKPAPEKTTQSLVMMLRLSPELKERLQKYRALEQSKTGYTVGLATAARRLLERALEQAGVK